jgi:hypothetical protein
MSVENSLLDLVLALESKPAAALRHPQQAEMPEWSGADVDITSDFQKKEGEGIGGHDLIVRTFHAPQLTWLFLELRDAFGDYLDASNKHGFYEALASAALKHLAEHQPEPEDCRPLLKSVLSVAFKFARELGERGAISPSPSIVVHSRDAEGRQRRQSFGKSE